MKIYKGSCLCGKVRFTINEPSGSDSQVHCHCRLCQRAHGAAFVTWVCQKSENFSLDNSEQSLRWYASTNEGRRGFCAHCGSTMFFRSSFWPDETHVTLANLHEQDDFKVQAHICYDTRASWVEVKDELPRRMTSELLHADDV